MNGELNKVWKRAVKKENRNNQGEITRRLRESMAKLLPVPQKMAEELADYYLPAPIEDIAIYRAQEILDIFIGEWFPEKSFLNFEDWLMIREIVNDWALEMDMGVVNNVMRLVVEQGGFSAPQASP